MPAEIIFNGEVIGVTDDGVHKVAPVFKNGDFSHYKHSFEWESPEMNIFDTKIHHEPQEARAASPLESAALNVAQRFSGARAVIDPASVLLWGQLVMSLLEMFRNCRANRDGSDAEQLIDAARRRRAVHVAHTRHAARQVFGRFNRREIVRAADAALDAAAESTPEEIEAIYADMESR